MVHFVDSGSVEGFVMESQLVVAVGVGCWGSKREVVCTRSMEQDLVGSDEHTVAAAVHSIDALAEHRDPATELCIQETAADLDARAGSQGSAFDLMEELVAETVVELHAE